MFGKWKSSCLPRSASTDSYGISQFEFKSSGEFVFDSEGFSDSVCSNAGSTINTLGQYETGEELVATDGTAANKLTLFTGDEIEHFAFQINADELKFATFTVNPDFFLSGPFVKVN